MEGQGVEEGEVNKPAEFTLQLADSHGQPVEGPGVVEVGVRSLVDGSVFQATVLPAPNRRHCVWYTPRSRGRHSITVQLNGREMAGSPFPVFVRFPPTQLKKPVRHMDGMK